MNDVTRYVDCDARRCILDLATHVELKNALEDEDPLLVGMRVRIGTGAGRHSHESDHYAFTLNARTDGGGIVGATLDLIESSQLEEVLAGFGDSDFCGRIVLRLVSGRRIARHCDRSLLGHSCISIPNFADGTLARRSPGCRGMPARPGVRRGPLRARAVQRRSGALQKS